MQLGEQNYIAIVMMDQSDDWKAKRRRNGTIVSKQFIKPSTYGKCYQCSRFSLRTAFYWLLIAHSAFTEISLAILIKGEVQTPSIKESEWEKTQM